MIFYIKYSFFIKLYNKHFQYYILNSELFNKNVHNKRKNSTLC